MAGASGRYRLEGASADFFGSRIFRLIDRGTTVIGRFGRSGVIQGQPTDDAFEGEWTDRHRRGWLKLRFDPSFRFGECEYGTYGPGEVSRGRVSLSKIVRAPRPAKSIRSGE